MPTETSIDFSEWHAKLIKRLAGHQTALINYEKNKNTSNQEYAIRRGETTTARAKLQGVSKMLYDWSSLTEDSKRMRLAEINEALEDAEKEIDRVV